MKLPVLTPKKLIKMLHRKGFIEIRQKGSHKFFSHPSGRTAVVPFHTKDISRGLLREILRETEILPKELIKK